MSRTPQRPHRPVRKSDPAKQAALADGMSRVVRQVLRAGLAKLGREAGDHAALFIERAHSPVAPARMAMQQRGDGAARRQARELYERCLAHYRHAVRPEDAGRGHDDVGAAIALFVAVNLHVLRLDDAAPPRITPRMLLRLEQQLSALVPATSWWHSSDAVERQFYFERLAILTVLVSETSRYATAQGPAEVANVRRTARDHLQQFLGIDPDLVTLGPDGLAIAGDPDTPGVCPPVAIPPKRPR